MTFLDFAHFASIRCCLVAIICSIAFGGSAMAQLESAADTSSQENDQKQVVRAIYEATKTAKSTKELTAFLEQCDEALAMELSTANRRYVISLRGWGLNRRGEKKFEMASQLKRIGNDQHESAMKQALEDFDAAIIAAPERYRSWLSRGIAHVSNQNFDRAILDFTEVTKLKADEPNGWFNRAEAFYHRGNFLPAIGDYEVVLRLNSDDAQALTGRGLSSFALQRYDAAVADFDRVISLCPENSAAYLNRGDTYQALCQWNQAESDFEQSIKLKETAAACQRLAWLKATCPDPDVVNHAEARQLVSTAIELGGETVANLDTLAAVEAANGDFESAKSNLSKVIGLVDHQDSDQTGPIKARLMLYENSEPFIQSTTVETTQSDSKTKLESSTDDGQSESGSDK